MHNLQMKYIDSKRHSKTQLSHYSGISC